MVKMKFVCEVELDFKMMEQLRFQLNRGIWDMIEDIVKEHKLKELINIWRYKISDDIEYIFDIELDPRAMLIKHLEEAVDEISEEECEGCGVKESEECKMDCSYQAKRREEESDECYVCEEKKSSGLYVADDGKDRKWLCEDCFKKSVNSS